MAINGIECAFNGGAIFGRGTAEADLMRIAAKHHDVISGQPPFNATFLGEEGDGARALPSRHGEEVLAVELYVARRLLANAEQSA